MRQIGYMDNPGGGTGFVIQLLVRQEPMARIHRDTIETA